MFALPIAHCMPLAKQLGILLFDDLHYMRTVILMHNIAYLHICPALQNMYTRCSEVHKINTRSYANNFYLNHAVTRTSKCFVTFTGVLWNSLSLHLKEINSLSLFKFKVSHSLFAKYV